MDQGLLALAFAAGLVAALNPCGFAMLPPYLLLVVGVERTGERRYVGLAPVGRALAATAGMALGFLTVFGLFGALTVSAFAAVQRYLPYMTVLIGIVLVALGIWLLLGRQLTGLKVTPLAGRWAPTVRLGSMYGYGVSYAVASLSCTIGPFWAVTAASFRGGSLLGSVSVYLAYVAGLSLIVGVLAVAAAFASSAVANRLRRILPLVNKMSGAVLVLAGLYVAYYGLFEVRILTAVQANAEDPVIAASSRVQGVLIGWVQQHGAWPWVLLLAALLLVGFAGSWYRRVRGSGETYRSQPRQRPQMSRTRTNSTSEANPIRYQFSIWPT